MSSHDPSYDCLERSIANDPHDPRRILPAFKTTHRRILDVGCGAGQSLAACKLSADILAVGVDIDHSALASGRNLVPSVRFLSAQGEALPFRDESFDFVMCRVALPYMEVRSALSEMYRVLRAGGDIWLTLHPFSLTAKELQLNLGRLQFRGAVYRTWVLMNGISFHLSGKQWRWPSAQGRYETWHTNRGITRALLAAGFEEIDIGRGSHFLVTARKTT